MRKNKKSVYETKTLSGWMEKSDYNEFSSGGFTGVPIFKTLVGCSRSLSGYENLRFGRVKIVISWEEDKNV